MARIIIDGREFNGTNVTIQNGRVVIDGVLQEGSLHGVVEVRVVEGKIGNLTCDGSASVAGNVEGDVDAGGSVQCGNVGGTVDAGGSVQCGNVSGNVDAGGSIRMGR